MTRESTLTMVAPQAPVAELVDASDLKSLDPKGSCRFESGRGHQSRDLDIMSFRVQP